MGERTNTQSVHRGRLFSGICLALIPTGLSFALVSNILGQLKQELIGPLLEGFGLRNGARLAFAGHMAGITVMIAAVTRAGDPSAFWILMLGAAILAAGNGMIEVTGNPLVAALYPEQKTVRLNRFHAFFPIGIVLGGIRMGKTRGRRPRYS